jgi:hypothetical protein
LEEQLHASGRDIHKVTLAEMENLWQQSKQLERQEAEEKRRP